MAAKPDISVLIPAYNEAALIADAIASVQGSFEAVGRCSHEIVVCDNNSTDATAAIARSNGARVVFEPHNQIARARNAAARAAQGQWFIFLDADTRLNAETLGATIGGLKSGRVGAGGAVIRMDGEALPLFLRGLVATWNGISRVFKLAAGSYVYCRREAWEATGGFDERYYVSEEIWFSMKLKRWCRRRGLKFEILARAPITTSSRKLKWFTPWQGCKQMVRLLSPRAMMSRQNCAMWYVRPANAALPEEEPIQELKP